MPDILHGLVEQMAQETLMVRTLSVKFHVRLSPQLPLSAKREPALVTSANNKVNSFFRIIKSLNLCRAQLLIILQFIIWLSAFSTYIVN